MKTRQDALFPLRMNKEAPALIKADNVCALQQTHCQRRRRADDYQDNLLFNHQIPHSLFLFFSSLFLCLTVNLNSSFYKKKYSYILYVNIFPARGALTTKAHCEVTAAQSSRALLTPSTNKLFNSASNNSFIISSSANSV